MKLFKNENVLIGLTGAVVVCAMLISSASDQIMFSAGGPEKIAINSKLFTMKSINDISLIDQDGNQLKGEFTTSSTNAGVFNNKVVFSKPGEYTVYGKYLSLKSALTIRFQTIRIDPTILKEGKIIAVTSMGERIVTKDSPLINIKSTRELVIEYSGERATLLKINGSKLTLVSKSLRVSKDGVLSLVK